MVGTAACLVGPAIQVVKWVSAPILRQFKYLYCFTTNITNLKIEAEKLQDVERDLQERVNAATTDLQLITREVEAWLRDSKNIINEEDVITKEAPNVGSGCLKLRARFSLSKRAVKTADRLKEFRDQCKFDIISRPRPPAATETFPIERTCEFESRKQIEEDIMATLRGKNVKMMGICGMGGLGKTTMAKRIWNRALDEHVFEEVVMAVVSQSIDKLKIQLEIGGSLGLKLDETSQVARVQKLHKRLSGTKRTLVILDDVWETFNLVEDLGIPRDYEGCTILLTSRNRDVLSAMKVEKIFGMEVLSIEDSWLLFRREAGQCVDTRLNSIAKEVVSECAGLPIALITVGAALKGEVDESIWGNALQRLKINCTPDNIPEYIKQVYNPLKLSYDALEHIPNYQEVFLLCCVYPEDAHIPLEQLTYFCMGLRLLEGAIRNVEEVRNRIRALTKVLKNRSLLLDSEKGEEYVRMHDVVRDVCIVIAKEKGYIGDNDLTSSLQRYKLHSGFELLQIRDSADKEIELYGIRDLYVLSIERCSQLTSLPFTQRPNNLITLVLDSCEGLETLSVVGELVNLEILICRDCDSIEELPPEIKGLKQLKVLDLTKCRNLKRIGRGIISSLVQLEELKMLDSFKKWEREDREGRENAGLKELGQLTKLRCLEIEIEDLALAADHLSSEVDRFTIIFSGGSFPSISDKYLLKRKMSLELKETISIEHWKPFLRETECLILSGNGANKVCLPELEKIRHLKLSWCESMKNVVTSMDGGGGAIVFPSIEHLILFQLPKLEEICDRPVSLYCFQILKEIKLSYLPALKQLWKSSQNDLGKDFLPQLEVLDISYCEKMEGVFLWKGEDGNENNSCDPITIRFPNLKVLRLYHLPNLISLCQGIEFIEFPLLRKLDVIRCRKMKGMVSNGMGSNENNSGGSSSNAGIHALFFPQQVSFGCLKKLDTNRNSFSELEKLKISRCQSILSLFTSSMAGNLVNLKVLWISNCDEMVEVMKDDEEKGISVGRQTALLFPKLQELILWKLPKLVSFCEWKCDIEFPSLSFFHGIEFPLLRKIQIAECEKMKGMVANGMSKENNSGGRNNNAADTSESQQVSFGCLKSLTTERNPFCSHTIDHVFLFNGLESLTITKCAGSQSLFTSSMVGNLVNLEELKISECDEMVEVIKDDEERGMSGGQKRALLFPKLQKLELRDLPKFVSFCESKGIESIQFPVLRRMDITFCVKMKGMVANGVTSNENNSGGSSTNAADIIHLFCQSKQVSFGCLKSLTTKRNPFCSHTIDVSLLNGVEELTISMCEGSRSLFTFSIARNLVNLKVLWIQDCEEMVEVIKDDEEKGMSGGQKRALLFPKLHTLQLEYLPKLVSFCAWKCDVELHSLRKVEIENCPNMKNFTLGSLAAPNLESFKTDLEDDLLLQVPFNTVKELSFVRNENPLNCYQIEASVFDRLEVLTINHYYGSMSLFSSSITGKLVNLTTLTIEKCFMVKVIEEKEEEKETVVSGAQSTTILFPKLHKIQLYELSKLVVFCEWKCDVELPSLTEVKICKCNNMKRFTLGPLNTPKLESVEIDHGKFGGLKDLNESVQQQWYWRREEEKEEIRRIRNKIDHSSTI